MLIHIFLVNGIVDKTLTLRSSSLAWSVQLVQSGRSLADGCCLSRARGVLWQKGRASLKLAFGQDHVQARRH